MTEAYSRDLDRNPANYQPLTPLSFLARSAAVFPDKLAVVHGAVRHDYATFYSRCRRLASALENAGIGRGDTVSVLLLNTPPMLEAHYGVPMMGGVLNALNTRLDAAGIAFILDHAEAKFVIVDSELAPLMQESLDLMEGPRPQVVEYVDPTIDVPATGIGGDYETFVEGGDADYAWSYPADEWDAISLNYTSGTTGNPKGVVYHHRGAYLLATGNVVHGAMTGDAVYLWTLPMFHCNGWCFPWSLSVVAGTHVCLRQVRAKAIFDADRRREGHPPLRRADRHVDAPERTRRRQARILAPGRLPHGGRAPAGIRAGGHGGGGLFDVTHLYGLTECYGPSVINEWKHEWDDLDNAAQARMKARQGVNYQATGGDRRHGSRDHDPGRPRRRDHRRDHDARQRRHEGLSEEPQGNDRGVRRRLVPHRRSRRDASRTATSRSRTAPRT